MLENISPDLGAEQSREGIPIECFTFEDVQNGFIRYYQANHKAVEPTCDNGTLQATDGNLNSTIQPLKVTITPVNDETPALSLEVGTISCKVSEYWLNILTKIMKT